MTAVSMRTSQGDDLTNVIQRAANHYDRWSEQVARTGYCAKPVRLVGQVAAVEKDTGEIVSLYDTEGEPDKSLLIACGDRRESRCPSCAATYRGDAFQLVSAGLVGGKGVPATVAEHPGLFVTLTAPSFGPVHAHRATGAVLHPCRPRRSGKCPHGLPLACWQRHGEDNPAVGQPLCPKCFDYEGQVLWNALAPELWRRTTIYVRRELGRSVGLRPKELGKKVRLSYVKVAEYQRRGALHFHAVLRLDAACPEGTHIGPPPDEFNIDVLEEALTRAVRRVAAPLPLGDSGAQTQVVARWGEQLDMRRIGDRVSLSGRAVAAYVAKYATKCSDDLGVGDVRSLAAVADTRHHLVTMVRAAERLGGRAELRQLRLFDCAHALGFKGHWSTKSRRYSTTFTALRAARREHARRTTGGRRYALELLDQSGGGGQVLTRSQWRYVGSGYRNRGEAWLAMSAAGRAREHRRLAKEEIAIQGAKARKGGEV